LHGWLAGWPTTHRVYEPIETKNMSPSPRNHSSLARPFILQREVHGAYAAFGEHTHHVVKNGIASFGGNVLEDDERMNEVEFSVERHGIVALDEGGVCDSGWQLLSASRSMDAETSAPTTDWERLESGIVSRPTPQPKSRALRGENSPYSLAIFSATS
jgi:hypothetical protein